MKQQFRSLLFACTCAFFIVACSGKDNASMAGELAGQAAKAYYDQLLHGDYDSFVAGRYQPDSIPASFREQLVANAKMFLGHESDHGGIKEVKFLSAKADTSKHVADVFLTFVYGDRSTIGTTTSSVERSPLYMVIVQPKRL